MNHPPHPLDIHGNRNCQHISSSRGESSERAIASANGLDVRAIELVKFAVSGQAKLDELVPIEADCSVRLVGVNGRDLVFDLDAGGETLTATAPREDYERFADGIARSSIRGEHPPSVDKEWANHALDVMEAEGTLF